MLIITKLAQKKLFLPLLLFHLFVLVIVLFNFPFGKYLIGWDAINSEFNFGVNIERNISGVWQENYGLGTVGGHGFTSLLPHALITGLLDVLLPQSAVRPTFILLCYYLGGLGTFFLVNTLLTKIVNTKESWKNLTGKIKYLALISSIYYLLNLGTVQQFYLPLEAFVVQFAVLPWLFLSLLNLLQSWTPKHIITFILINIVASAQGFIPSIFVAYIAALTLFLLSFGLYHKDKINPLKKSFVILILTFVINAYWLLPVGYYTLTQSNNFLQAYNNIISTPEFIDKNKKYGDFSHVIQLKGFYLDGYQLGDYVFEPWLAHSNSKFFIIISFLIGLIAIGGGVASVWYYKNWIWRGFAFGYLYFLASLATNTIPFSWILSMLEKISSTYEQAFRTAFTKFIIGLSFEQSIFLSLGLLSLFIVLDRFKKNTQIFISGLIAFMGSLILYLGLPVLGGNLFYAKLKINLPRSYFEIMNYFNHQTDGRIADLPQDCPEGWYSYKWGYFGSGFMWYGVKQPFMSRSFDVWNPDNENYYWEITQALKQDNPSLVDAVLDKYRIRWILYDPNLIACQGDGGFTYSERFQNYLNKQQKYFLIQTFTQDGILPISLYENLAISSENYIYTQRNLPFIGPEYKWTDIDQGFLDYGNYITGNDENFDIYYPFRTLLLKRPKDTQQWEIGEDSQNIIFTSHLPKDLNDKTLNLPDYSSLESSVPVDLRLDNKDKQTYILSALLQPPKLSISGVSLVNKANQMQLGELDISDPSLVSFFINGIKIDNFAIDNTIRSYFYLGKTNKIDIYEQNKLIYSWSNIIDSSFGGMNLTNLSKPLIPLFSDSSLTIAVPKSIDNLKEGVSSTDSLDQLVPRPCNSLINSKQTNYQINKTSVPYLRFDSQDTQDCLGIGFTDLKGDFAYLVSIASRNISGNPLKLNMTDEHNSWLLNSMVIKSSDFTQSYYLIPPRYSDAKGNKITVKNESYSNTNSINDFSKINIWHFPYKYLKSIKIFSQQTKQNCDQVKILKVRHVNSFWYSTNLLNAKCSNQFIVLSQAYHPGWIGLSKTNSGWQALPHVKVNNWANGWDLSSLDGENTIYLIFWPQILEFIGLVMLGVTVLAIFLKRKRN